MSYTVILEQDPDGGYVAIVSALPGCVSQGETRAEVMANIREAAELYIEDCVAAAGSRRARPRMSILSRDRRKRTSNSAADRY
jgi:predicted RNase H-like HicB family nuclease